MSTHVYMNVNTGMPPIYSLPRTHMSAFTRITHTQVLTGLSGPDSHSVSDNRLLPTYVWGAGCSGSRSEHSRAQALGGVLVTGAWLALA